LEGFAEIKNFQKLPITLQELFKSDASNRLDTIIRQPCAKGKSHCLPACYNNCRNASVRKWTV